VPESRAQVDGLLRDGFRLDQLIRSPDNCGVRVKRRNRWSLLRIRSLED